jgi:hypothetical protein
VKTSQHSQYFYIFKSHVTIDPKPFITGPKCKQSFCPRITNTDMNQMFWIILFLQSVYFTISKHLICTGRLFYHEQALYLYRVSLLSWASTLFVQGVSFIVSKHFICTGCLFYREQLPYLYRASLLSWASTLFVQGVSFIVSKHFICTGCLFYLEQALYLYRVSLLSWASTLFVQGVSFNIKKSPCLFRASLLSQD